MNWKGREVGSVLKCLALAVLLGTNSSVSWAEQPSRKAPPSLEQGLNEQMKNDSAGRKSQARIDEVAEQTQNLLDEYRSVLRQIDNTEVYNKQMQDMISSQLEEMQSMRKQTDSLNRTNKEIIPLMVRMIDSLESFVDMDVPFLPEERANRVKELHSMMSRADVSTSEKYRRVMEAYQVENEYGRTIEAYKGLQNIDGKELTVEFLRVGRLALIYQSLDGDRAGLWIPEKKQWIALPSKFKKPISQGLKMARKQLAPDLLTLPLPLAQEVRL